MRRVFTLALLQIKVLDRDKTRKGKTEDENLGEVRTCTPHLHTLYASAVVIIAFT